MKEPHSPAKSYHFESIIPDSKPLQDSTPQFIIFQKQIHILKFLCHQPEHLRQDPYILHQWSVFFYQASSLDHKGPRLDQVRSESIHRFCFWVESHSIYRAKFWISSCWLAGGGFPCTHSSKETSVKRRPLVHEHKWTDPESELKVTRTQDLISKNMNRKSMRWKTRARVPWAR